MLLAGLFRTLEQKDLFKLGWFSYAFAEITECNELGNVIQYPWKSFPMGNIALLRKKSSCFLYQLTNLLPKCFKTSKKDVCSTKRLGAIKRLPSHPHLLLSKTSSISVQIPLLGTSCAQQREADLGLVQSLFTTVIDVVEVSVQAWEEIKKTIFRFLPIAD